jgi:hypothetical protein
LKRKLIERITYLDDEYAKSITYLHNIYLKIKEYISFCSSNEFEGILREFEVGDRILTTIQFFISKLKNRFRLWRKEIAEKRTKNIQNINDNTEDANENSQNIYNIRIGIEDPNERIYRQLDTTEKNQVRYLAKQYFKYLKNLDFLMKPFTENNEILRLWPFEDQEVTSQIDEWLKR